MRKLALALGVSAAVLFAGGIAWKADATTWRSGTLNLPSAAKNYSPIEKTACGGWGGTARRDTPGVAAHIGAGAGLASLTRGRRATARDIHSRPPRVGGLVFSLGIGEKMDRTTFLLASARDFNNLRFTVRSESTRFA